MRQEAAVTLDATSARLTLRLFMPACATAESIRVTLTDQHSAVANPEAMPIAYLFWLVQKPLFGLVQLRSRIPAKTESAPATAKMVTTSSRNRMAHRKLKNG
jgi:hypothetical protein